MSKLQTGEWISINNLVFEIVLLNYLDNRATLKSVNNSMKEFKFITVELNKLADYTVLGNPKNNESLRLLYG